MFQFERRNRPTFTGPSFEVFSWSPNKCGGLVYHIIDDGHVIGQSVTYSGRI